MRPGNMWRTRPEGHSLARPLSIAALLLATGLVLAACDRDRDDLEGYIEDTLDRPGGEIDPIPQIEPYEPFDYTGLGARAPFEPDDRLDPDLAAEETDEDGPTPDEDRREEFLEQFPLDSLEMQGTLEMEGVLYALIRDPEGVVHRIRTGNYMGQNHGEVVEIADDRVILNELVSDGTGGWNEREARLSLSD